MVLCGNRISLKGAKCLKRMILKTDVCSMRQYCLCCIQNTDLWRFAGDSRLNYSFYWVAKLMHAQMIQKCL